MMAERELELDKISTNCNYWYDSNDGGSEPMAPIYTKEKFKNNSAEGLVNLIFII